MRKLLFCILFFWTHACWTTCEPAYDYWTESESTNEYTIPYDTLYELIAHEITYLHLSDTQESISVCYVDVDEASEGLYIDVYIAIGDHTPLVELFYSWTYLNSCTERN